MKISVTLSEINNQYIASCPELEINCYGSDKCEATRRIREVLSFYIRSAEELGLEVEQFEHISIDGKDSPFNTSGYSSASATIN